MRFFTIRAKPRHLFAQAMLTLALALIVAPCAFADEGMADGVQMWNGGAASVGLVYEVAEQPAQTTVPKAAEPASTGAARPMPANQATGVPRTGDESNQMIAGIAAASVAGVLLVMIGLWRRRWTDE